MIKLLTMLEELRGILIAKQDALVIPGIPGLGDGGYLAVQYSLRRLPEKYGIVYLYEAGPRGSIFPRYKWKVTDGLSHTGAVQVVLEMERANPAAFFGTVDRRLAASITDYFSEEVEERNAEEFAVLPVLSFAA